MYQDNNYYYLHGGGGGGGGVHNVKNLCKVSPHHKELKLIGGEKYMYFDTMYILMLEFFAWYVSSSYNVCDFPKTMTYHQLVALFCINLQVLVLCSKMRLTQAMRPYL